MEKRGEAHSTQAVDMYHRRKTRVNPASPMTEFSDLVEIVWQKDVTRISGAETSGKEGYAAVKVVGTFSKISFEYMQAESFVNFLFGASSCTSENRDEGARRANSSDKKASGPLSRES